MSGFDDADLALLEVNSTSPIVQKLIQQVRRLEDEIVHRDLRIEELEERLEELE